MQPFPFEKRHALQGQVYHWSDAPQRNLVFFKHSCVSNSHESQRRMKRALYISSHIWGERDGWIAMNSFRQIKGTGVKDQTGGTLDKYCKYSCAGGMKRSERREIGRRRDVKAPYRSQRYARNASAIRQKVKPEAWMTGSVCNDS